MPLIKLLIVHQKIDNGITFLFFFEQIYTETIQISIELLAKNYFSLMIIDQSKYSVSYLQSPPEDADNKMFYVWLCVS